MTPPTAIDRTMAAFRALVRSVFPSFVYALCHEYAVHDSDGLTFSGIPTDATFSPALPTRVPYAAALAGSYSIVPAGTIAHVVFVNADPSKPRCVGFDLPTDPSSVVLANATPTATSPTTAASERRVVCYGDIVTVGTAAGPLGLVGGTCSKVRA